MHPKQATYKLDLAKFLENMNPERIRELILLRFAAVFLDSHGLAPMSTRAVDPASLPDRSISSRTQNWAQICQSGMNTMHALDQKHHVLHENQYF